MTTKMLDHYKRKKYAGIVFSSKESAFEAIDTRTTKRPGNYKRRKVSESWEAELSYDGESDPHSLIQDCDTNPGHLNFVPINKFYVDDLPPGYQDEILVDLVRAMSDLTVRVSVKCISERRYEIFHGSSKPYLDYSKKFTTRVGSEWVEKVEKYPNKYNSYNITCECKECVNSPTPKTEFAYIHILTETHVVCDDLEGANTTCHLFFDKGDTPDLCDSVVTLISMSHVWNAIFDNRCNMAYATHDLDLIDRLDKLVDHWRYVKCKAKINFLHTTGKQKSTQPAPDARQPLTIIVSHPHGDSKQVSVGHCTNLNKTESYYTQYIYTTPTCPGSCGAQVCVIGGSLDDLYYTPVHVGKCKGDKGLNYSSGIPEAHSLSTTLGSDIQERKDAVTSTIWRALKMDIAEDKSQIPEINKEQTGIKAAGPWEVNVVYDGEKSDLHKKHMACHKNPGHMNFIPVDQFKVDYLPSSYHDNNLVDLVQAMSDLTVRVSVKHTSERRPETFPGSSKFYLDHSEKDMMSVGSGWVERVNKYPNKYSSNNVTCECEECLNSPTPKKQFAHIHILTEANVVYDDLEGAHTTCHLFFDRGGRPGLCDGVVTIRGMSRVRINMYYNRCEMTHVTHDLNLADRLNTIVDHWCHVKKKVKIKYCLPTSEKLKSAQLAPDARQPLVIIVSHPHGCSKQVSVGYCTNMDKRESSNAKYLYTTPTCPGSSGARVCVIGGSLDNLYNSPVHVGKCKGDKRLNYSSGRPETHSLSKILSSDIQERKDPVKSTRWCALKMDIADSLYPEESCEGENDLHQQVDPCVKNPDHLKSIPLDQFNVGHLPLCYHDNDLVSLVRAMSDLTVCVSVKYVSEQRPETYPGSDVPYPCYSNRGSDTTRVGTGRVTLVYKYPEEYDLEDEGNATCQCKECLSSPTPKTEFAHIRIETAAHIVYDKQEAAQTTCHLFFDSGDKPDDCQIAVALSGMLHVFSNTLIDRCEMKYVTHDQELIKKLDKKVNLWNMLADRAEEKYLDPISEKHKSPSSLEHIPDAMHTLTIIVSHPGGGSKQVSIGHYTNIEDDEGDWSQRTYTTGTCPGANGAPVFVLGRRRWCDWFYSHVHSKNCVVNKEINVKKNLHPSGIWCSHIQVRRKKNAKKSSRLRVKE